MDETLWELFWSTGLPEVYALAKEAGSRALASGAEGPGSLPAKASPEGHPV